MKKRTAIIDIGSNSARLVIFEATSQFGFQLISEQKSKVRIGEGAYKKQGYLQPIGIRRAFLTLKSFLYSIEKYQVSQTICVATSALRDAPNGKDFTQWIEKELGLYIEIIDGQEEAYYGGIAAVNLLPIKEGISIDIGGGSSDLALLKEGQIVDTYSLDLGTVRLKELFFDQHKDIKQAHKEAKQYIDKALRNLPSHFKHTLAIGIGGTARTLSKGIMEQIGYPLDKLHAFSYTVEIHNDYLKEIPSSSIKNLSNYHLQKNRFDTIREGTLIFNKLLSHLGTKEVISSAVGVREGVFLKTFLDASHGLFPKDKNPSIISLLDRFKPLVTIEKKRKVKLHIASRLYEIFYPYIQCEKSYEHELLQALKLSNIGKTLTIYKAHKHAFYIATQELNYGFTHKEIVLISLLLRMHGKDLLNKSLYKTYKSLLPDKDILRWLSFIYSLSVFLHEASNSAKITFEFTSDTLIIVANTSLYLAKEKIDSLERPFAFDIVIEDESHLPKNKTLGV